MEDLRDPLITEDDVARLYPDLTRAVRREVARSLAAYVAHVIELYEWLVTQPERYAQFRELMRKDGSNRSAISDSR